MHGSNRTCKYQISLSTYNQSSSRTQDISFKHMSYSSYAIQDNPINSNVIVIFNGVNRNTTRSTRHNSFRFTSMYNSMHLIQTIRTSSACSHTHQMEYGSSHSISFHCSFAFYIICVSFLWIVYQIS